MAITAPANGLTVRCPTPVSLIASASDADGTIVRVAFFDGPTRLGTATAAPWRITLNTLVARPHGIVAMATDNSGNTSFSVPVVVTVTR